MAKLYLIRRNMESFTGPLTQSEVKDAFKRMAFGLQDEVSGHCGPWVTLDDLEQIKRYYPEIARIVHEDLVAGWGVSAHEQRLDGPVTKRLKVKSSRSLTLAILFAVIALGAFLAAMYMANSARLSSKTKDPALLPTPDNLQTLLTKKDSVAFDKLLEDNLDMIVGRVQKEAKADSSWLPYLRHYALTHDGSVGALPAKLLRGDGVEATPADCSQKIWRKYWRAAVRGPAAQMANERKFVRDHWARVLAWDPYWIRRRNQGSLPGWLSGESYYTLCLTIAERSLTAILGEQASTPSAESEWERIGMNKIHQRLQWVLEVVRDGSSRLPANALTGDPLSQWTCMEAAKDLAGLARCRAALAASNDEWQTYTDDRASWALLRLALLQRGPLAPELPPAMAAVAEKVAKLDFFTHFDYRAEARLFKLLAKPPASPPAERTVEKAVEKVEGEFPETKMLH